MAYPITKARAEGMVLAANGAEVTDDSARAEVLGPSLPSRLVPAQVRGGKRMYTCALRPTGVYGDGDELIRDFYKQCVQRGGVVVQGVPEHIEHGRVYVGESGRRRLHPVYSLSASCLQPVYSLPEMQPVCSPFAACLQPSLFVFVFFLISPRRF